MVVCDARRCRKLHLILGHIEIRLVQRQRFDKVGVPLEDRADSLRDG
jgi:hypothetical protein